MGRVDRRLRILRLDLKGRLIDLLGLRFLVATHIVRAGSARCGAVRALPGYMKRGGWGNARTPRRSYGVAHKGPEGNREGRAIERRDLIEVT